MAPDKKVSDAFTGLVGILAIGLLVATMLFGLLVIGGGNELQMTAANSTAPQTPNPTAPSAN